MRLNLFSSWGECQPSAISPNPLCIQNNGNGLENGEISMFFLSDSKRINRKGLICHVCGQAPAFPQNFFHCAQGSVALPGHVRYLPYSKCFLLRKLPAVQEDSHLPSPWKLSPSTSGRNGAGESSPLQALCTSFVRADLKGNPMLIYKLSSH